MIKKLKLTSALLLTQNIFCSAATSAEIELTITGMGEVTVLESDTKCTSNCAITNELAKSTLIATAETGYTFKGWTGQSCSSGKGVNFSEVRSEIGGAPGGAKTLVVADLNNDLVDDLASISLFNGSISVLLNNADRTFSKTIIASDLNYPSSMDFYDWDNDGDQDLVVAEYGMGLIKLYNNDGSGKFSFAKNLEISAGSPYAIAVEDINNDNEPDLLVSKFTADISGDLYVLVNSINSADTSWYKNDGLDNFELADNVSKIAAITLDTHSYEDLSMPSIITAEIEQGDIALYTSKSNIVSRTVINSGNGAYGVAFGDADKDGLIDVLSAHYRPSELKIVYGTGMNEFGDSITLLTPEEGVTATIFSDLNNDSYVDVGTGEFNNNTFFYLASEGYENCVVTKDEKISLTANFELLNEATPTPAQPAVKKETSDGGGGGSMPLQFFFLMLSILSLRQLAYARNKN